jgi:hypothetical protein
MDASTLARHPPRSAANSAEIREIGGANQTGQLGQSCRLHLDLEQYCRIIDWTPEPTLAAGPALSS